MFCDCRINFSGLVSISIIIQVAETYRAGFCGNPNQQFDDLTGRHGELTVSSE